MGVRKNTRSATGVHLLPPNRPRPGIQTTHCRGQSRKSSARPYGKFRRILSGRIPICEACRNVFQRSRHIYASGAGDRGGCGVPSIARRQIQYRSGRAGETRGKTSGAAATIPEAERILRRDSRRNSRFARAGAAALGAIPATRPGLSGARWRGVILLKALRASLLS
jgi:hypothetical protein